PYAPEVLADQPTGYWRLGEGTGSAANDATFSGHDATYAGTVTLGGSGGIAGDPDTAPTFGGGHVDLPDGTITHPLDTTGEISVEMWFKTTGDGILLGYHDNVDPAASWAHVPALYVGTDGKLRGSIWNL